MKLFKILSLSLVLSVAMLSAAPLRALSPLGVYNETPAKTIILKHPMAADANTYFASGTFFHFEVYKPGSSDDVAKIVAALKSDPAVESVSLGALTGGDYQAITLTLKTAQNKAWFISEFKKAGLNTIRINNNPVVPVEKI
jgi:hypothetical protein